jgi:PAS domain S-box-containing protein
MVSNDISILFVEDDKEVRAQISDFLTSNMFKDVYVANNGKDGLLKYNIHKPDIVLSDLNMPIMDGLEMSRAIKALDENTPILLITSNFEKNVTEAAVDIGIEGRLFKPLSLNRVEKILTKYIEKIMFQREFKNKQKLLEQYKSIIDISSSVTKTDINGIITYVNNPFCDMSGYSKDELLGKNHTIISHPDNSKEFYEEIYSTLRDKKIWRGHIKNRRKNCDSYYESSVIAPILDENDEIVECISLKQYIT